MTEAYTAGCACRAIRYECNAEPMFTRICYCRECQRSTGTGGAVKAVFEKSAASFTQGEPEFHERVGTSGYKTQCDFCAECGSPLAAKADLFPAIHGISAASLDNPNRLRLVANIWTSSAPSWDHLAPSLAKIGQTPSEAEVCELARLGHDPWRALERMRCAGEYRGVSVLKSGNGIDRRNL